MNNDPKDGSLSKSSILHKYGFVVFLATMAIAIFHVYTAGTSPFMHMIQRSLHVCLAIIIRIGVHPLGGKGEKSFTGGFLKIIDAIFSGLAAFIAIYMILHWERMLTTPWLSTKLDLVLASFLIFLVLDAGRRTLGYALPSLAIISLLYARFGNYFPGVWNHPGFTIKHILEQLFMSPTGMWGLSVQVSANTIAIFVLFGAVLLVTGGSRGFIDVALFISGRAVGGAAKVAALASAMFGTISGSAVANVGSTGPFTIPLMKKLGYKPEVAAGVEAAASTGGQIMPPIMAAGAFVMAELLNIPYLSVIKAALIPALLYFIGLLMSIHFESQRTNLKALPREMIPKFKDIASVHNLPLFVPLMIFIFSFARGSMPERAAFNALSAAVLLYIFLEQNIPIGIRCRNMIVALQKGGITVAQVASLAACAQIVISIVGLTGVGVKLTQQVLLFSGGFNIIALFLVMIASLILGMGIPTTAAYLLAASTAAPALSRLGIPDISAHLFIFYYAIISAITPPVCGAVYVAAPIAEANWIKTANVAVKFALVGFIVPFLFVLHPQLLMQGDPIVIARAVFTAVIGVFALSASTIGYMFGNLTFFQRLLTGIAALMSLFPGLVSDIGGIAVLCLVIVLRKITTSQKSFERGSHNG